MTRLSLLQPGRTALPLPRPEFLLLLGVYLASVAVRWGLRDVQPYTAESTHFFVARGLWDSTSNIRYLDGIGGYDDYSWFFWQRPFLTLPFWPAAQHSFLAYRTVHVLLVAAFPALGAWLLRSLGVGPLPAYAATAAASLHPVILPWTVLFLPDALVLTMTLAALLLAHHGRPAATALTLLAASWVKEVAFVTTLTLLVLAVWRDETGRPAWRRPWRVPRFAAWLAPLVPLAFLPLYVSLQVDGAVFPGFRPGGDEALMYETLWGLIWLAPLPLLCLLDGRTRRFGLVAMAWPAFFLVYHYTRDKAIESWYNTIPAAFTLLAAAAGLAMVWQRRGKLRWAAPPAALVVALLLAVQLYVPHTHDVNHAVTTPWSGRGQWNHHEVRHAEEVRDDDMRLLMASVPAHERRLWTAQDVDWALIQYPVSDEAEEIVKVYSVDRGLTQEQAEGWAHLVENVFNATLVFNHPTNAGNLATRAAYAECSDARVHYTLILASRCKGAGSDLWVHYQRITAA